MSSFKFSTRFYLIILISVIHIFFSSILSGVHFFNEISSKFTILSKPSSTGFTHSAHLPLSCYRIITTITIIDI